MLSAKAYSVSGSRSFSLELGDLTGFCAGTSSVRLVHRGADLAD